MILILYTTLLYFAKLQLKKMHNSEKYFSSECKFLAGAAKIEQIPNLNLSEFAFVGRSNVGKSSLINTLVNRLNLARISQNPGCTKQINFFNIGNFFTLVDLPGYGFARISNDQRKLWNNLILFYLRNRVQLKKVFLLIDSRHEIKEIDLNTMNFLDNFGVSYQVVLTKIDKADMLQQRVDDLNLISKKHGACHPEIIVTSSKNSLGIEKLRESIIKMI